MPEITEATAKRLREFLKSGSSGAAEALGLADSFRKQDLDEALRNFLCDAYNLAREKGIELDLSAIVAEATAIHQDEAQFIPAKGPSNWVAGPR